jgi:hypothetical protein
MDDLEQSRLATIYGHLRERLLDLSLRNPMLSFKHRATSKRQLQIVDAVPEEVYRKLVGEDVALELLPLPDLDEIPVDECSEEFLSALAHARASNLEYLTKVKALESAGRDDEFALAEVERDLRDQLRNELGFPGGIKRYFEPDELFDVFRRRLRNTDEQDRGRCHRGQPPLELHELLNLGQTSYADVRRLLNEIASRLGMPAHNGEFVEKTGNNTQKGPLAKTEGTPR